jgi:YgiT-type zinc finger domain-containing protein
MNCNAKGCPGHYEEQRLSSTEEVDGHTVVISDVPAQVCDFCGEVLTSWDTMAQEESFLESNPKPIGTAPVFEFLSQWTPHSLEEEPVGIGRIKENGHCE